MQDFFKRRMPSWFASNKYSNKNPLGVSNPFPLGFMGLISLLLAGCGLASSPQRPALPVVISDAAQHEYTSRYLRFGDCSRPARVLCSVMASPLQVRAQVIPADYSPVGKQAILAEARRRTGH